MIEASVEHISEFKAEQYWAVIADFGNVDWIPGVEKVDLEGEGIGMIRHLTVPVFPPLQERLDAIDPENMTLDYSISQVEYLQVKGYSARAQVFALPEGCRVVWSGQAEADGVDDARAITNMTGFYKELMTWIEDYLKK